jgi:hypothetical protein
MATPTFCCGFECGQLGIVGQHWQDAGGTGVFSFSTSTKRSGDRSLRCNPSAQTSQLANGAYSTTSQTLVARAYVYFATLPTTNDVSLIAFTRGLARFSVSDNKIYAHTGFAAGATGVAVTTGQWYRIDIKVNSSANPWTVDVSVDGVACGQATRASAAANNNAIELLVGGSSWSGDVFIDDFVMSITDADYPIGAGKVEHFIPTSDGTHNIAGAGDFQRTTTGTDILNATTTAYQLVDDVPLESGSGTDWINMVAPPNATDYVECVFGPASGISTPTTAPRAVEVIAGIRQAGTGTGNMLIQLNDNGTTATVYTATTVAGVTTIAYKRAHFADPPSAASVWNVNNDGSDGDFRDLRVRFRSPAAVDANPDQYFTGVMIEAEFEVITGTEVFPGVGALTIEGLAPTVAVTSNKNLTPSVGALDITGFAPTAVVPRNILADVGALAVAGFEPTVSITNNLNVSAGFGELALNGFEPTVEAAADINVLADVGSLTIDGFNPTVSTPKNILADTGEINIIGFDPSIQTPRNIQTDVGSVSITGLSPTVQTPRNIQSDLGEITISGLSPTVSVTNHISVTPGTGEIVLSGHEPAIGSNINITPSFGEISITGFAPAVNVTVSANTQTGVVDFNGFAPTVQTPVNINIGYGEILIDGFNPTINIGGGEALVETSTGMILISGLAPHVRGGRKQFIIKKSRVSNDANRFSTAVDESKQSQIGNEDKHSTIEDGI